MSERESSPTYLSVEEALNHAAVRSAQPALWKGFLNFFMVFYMFCVGCQLIEIENDWRRGIIEHTWPFMAALGWYQNWSLFSPFVRHISYHETAIITFADGTTRIYEYPRMDQMSIVERFRREKLRKMFGDDMPWEGYSQFLPVFARHLARSSFTKENPPVQISYVFNVVETPDPIEHGVQPRSKPLQHTDKKITFVYQVRGKELYSGQGLRGE